MYILTNSIFIAQTSAHYWYKYRSCLCLIICFGGTRNWFLTSENHFLIPHNKLSDVNKTYIDISNGQKFELYFFSKRFLTCKASCKFFSCSWLWPFWDMNSLLILTSSVSATSVWIDAFAISALSSCLSFINCSIFCSFSFRADFNLSGAKKSRQIL